MSKKYNFKIREESMYLFFPKYRIKSKHHIIEILLESCRYILYEDLTDLDEENMLLLNIDKMSRIFFKCKNKFYSIYFPFFIYNNDDERKIYYKDIFPIDAKLISDTLGIIKDNRFNSDDYLDFAETFVDIDDKYLGRIWGFLKDLLIFEEGYLRLDNDLEAYLKAKESGKEHTHPKNHIDIFYTSGNTFKIGLTKDVENNFFIDLLNTNTDCIYLKN